MSLNSLDRVMDTDIFVIGGGQSGMSTAQQCIKNNIEYIMVDSNKKAGESRENRYHNLELFTPTWLSSLPGLRMSIDGKRPTKDDMAQYLRDYEAQIGITTKYSTSVINIERINDNFLISSKLNNTNDVIQYTANNIVIATGPFKDKNTPLFSSKLNAGVQQIHSSEYTSPTQIESDEVCIVGGGNSGYQIANELDKAGKKIIHSTRSRTVKTPAVNLKRIIAKLKFGLKDMTGEYPCYTESNDIPVPWQEIVFGKKYNNLKKIPQIIDCYRDGVITSDLEQLPTKSIIRCTGFKNQYPWINIEGALDEDGSIIHTNGITNVPGLYTMDCIGRIDSSVRVARRLIKDVLTRKKHID